ncbi:MAG: InlB B-repeat-containing protein, partial [Candidatus Riflebacteria bacterium]|nr:InlB B-repeat-containing protein [Candidatus Riflebacteria bacterium]
MSRISKQFYLQTLFLLLVGIAITVVGCRIGGGFDGDDESNQATVSLAGNILMPPDAIASLKLNTVLAGEQLLAAKLSGYVAAAGAEVWIEELPDFPHEITDQNGNYEFKRLPPGNYHVIASLKKTDGSFVKVRSAELEIELKSEKITAPDLGLAPANKVVAGVLRDADGNFLPPGTLLTLWGEKFYVGEGGAFTSPALPDDVETADIIVAQPIAGETSRPTVTVQLLSTTEPTTVEIQVGDTTSQPQPFSASLKMQKNGLPISAENIIKTADQVDLTLTLNNIDLNTSGLTIAWDSGRGSFATDPTNKDAAIWVAPADSGMATISVKVSAPDRGSFKVFMPVVVDLAVKAPTYTMIFDAQGGSAVTAQTVESGAKATEPAAPTRTGYTFGGWYKEAACASLWDFGTDTVPVDTTIYAKWIAVAVTTYTVTFDSQSGSAVTAQTVESGAKATEPTAPTRTGFTFAGWYKEAVCTNLWDFGADTITANTTVYAKWISAAVTTYTVTFDSQSGSAVTAQTVESGAKATEPTAPTRTGFTFAGWYKEA